MKSKTTPPSPSPRWKPENERSNPAHPCNLAHTGLTATDRAADEEIRDRAYSIWENAGRPENCELAHWRAAEAEVMGET